jgi:RNA polymerase primary sigma factor
MDESDMEELHGFLERSEIELVEDIDPATAAGNIERAPAKRTRPPQGSAGSQAGRDDD